MCQAHSGLFLLERGVERLLLVLYVDDMPPLSKPSQMAEEAKRALKSHVEMADMGEARLMLGIEIVPTKDGLRLTQASFIQETLEELNMENYSYVRAPMEPGLKPPSLRSNYEVLPDIVPSRRLVGKLLYLSNGSRPDLAFSVSLLARFTSKPGQAHCPTGQKSSIPPLGPPGPEIWVCWFSVK